MNETLVKFFAFTNLVGKLKKIERFKDQYYWRDYPFVDRYESVADHCWRLALLVVLFSQKLSQKFDSEKALMMALIHDLPEIIAGDESPLGKDGTGQKSHAFNEEVQKSRHLSEKQAAKKVFGHLPAEKGDELLGLWLEFEEQISFESKVVKALDRLEAGIQVLEYTDGELFPKHLEFALSYNVKGSEVDPAIAEFAKLIESEFRKKYKEFR
ncbi:MAG: HD domain-containing protein [Patescibacteria group bacterium]|nr:HD domain-containing protein [Patescibacteria group bacterium]